MADYQAQIRLGIQGLGQLRQLETRLQSAVDLLGRLEEANANVGQAAQSSQRNVEAAGRRRAVAGRELRAATRTVENVAMRRDPNTGLFLPGGANATARRLANANLRLAQREVREADRNLREEEQNRRLIYAAQRRYARALDRAGNIVGGVQGGINDTRQRVDAALRSIRRESRDNYLDLLFGGRQQRLAQEGGGRRLPANLQQQIVSNRTAFDLARSAGDLPTMSRLATELVGLVRAQNEQNRLTTGRSGAFEKARRGQERLDVLAERPGVDDARIRRLRAQAAGVIQASQQGDITRANSLARRMNAAIMRYTRELDAAARELKRQQMAGGPASPIGGTVSMAGSPAALARSARMGGPAEAIKGRKDLPGSPAYYEEQRRQLQRAIRAGGPREGLKGRKDLPGSPAYYEEQRRQLQRAIRAGGPSLPIRGLANLAGSPAALERAARLGGARESIRGRKDLPGSPAFLEEQRKQQAQQLQRAIRAGGPRESIRGRKDLPGSPAYYEEQQRQLQRAIRAGGPAESLKGRKDLPGSPAFLEEQRKQLAKAVRAGGPSLPLQGTKTAIGSPAQIAAAEKAATVQARQESIVAAREDRLAKLAQQGVDVSQLQIQLDKAKTRVGDASVKSQERFKRSILALDTNVRRLSDTIAKTPAGAKTPAAQPGFFRGNLRKAVSEGLIGGAFPLLFGQGVGASAGGAAGGFAGGLIGGSFGFGLSLIGTALGQVVDTAVNKLGTLGGALSNATDSMAALEQAGFRLRDSQKIQIAQLEKVGQGYEAQKVVLKEIESRLGPGSVQQIERLNEAQKELSDAWAQLSLQLGTTLIPVIIEAANFINDLLGGPRPTGNASEPTLNRPRKPSDVLADLDALIAGNERNKAANREYAGLMREVEDFRRENEDKIFTMRRQAADIEKQKSDLRLEIESKIFNMRQESARLEIENARSRAQIAIESFDLQLARQADALGGRGGEFIDQVREYLRIRETGEADLQAKAKTTNLQLAAQERELQIYILQVSDKVAAIARTVEDYKRDQAKFRFETSRRLEDYRIKAEDYIYDRFKERYEYAIGSEQEILRLRMEAAAQMGVSSMPPDAAAVLGGAGTGRTEIGRSGLASPVGAQSSGRPPNWNQGLGAGRGHRGQDVGVDVGTTIHAMEDAIVDSIIRGFGEVGDAVVLRYRGSGNLGVYGHINPAAGIVPGQAVTAGQQIGLVTPDLRSGGRNNTHLHYEYWRRSRGPAANLLDPSERLRGAIYNRRPSPPSPVTQSQTRQAPRMLLPPAAGPTPQMFAPATTDSMFDRRSSLPGGGFDMASLSKLGTEYAPVAQLGPAPPPLALPPPQSQRIDAFSTVVPPAGAAPGQAIPVVPFTGSLPTYQPAPVATPVPPAMPQLPAAPAPMAPVDTSALTRELGRQRDELLENIELLKKLQDLENGRLLLQLGSTREVRNRLEDAAREFNLETRLLGVNTSLSQNEQERAAERIRTALATEDLNTLEQQTLGFAKELLDAKKLEQQEYDQITRGIQDRIAYEKELLQIAEDRAEVARQQAFLQRAGEVRRQINLTGAGLRSGLIGVGARAFEAQRAKDSSVEQAKAMAELSQRLEDQQLIWDNLEKNIVDVSNAISGGLTNGLLDVISGAKKIEDVGREVLDGIARTFADAAQQQLSTLMQRKLASMLGGPEGPLTKMLGGASAAAGPQALDTASLAASVNVWDLSAAAFAASATLRTIAGQAAISGAFSGFGSAAASGIGSAFSSAAPNILGSFFPGASPLPSFPFGGFRANGGTAVPGKGYIVGENEPEFFFPGVTGRVVPRSDMEKAAALQEGESSNEPIDIRYTVTEQRGERYVTEEQFRKGMASTSKRTQAMTYAGMRNNQQIREYAGI